MTRLIGREATFWMPEQASTWAPSVDWLFYYIFWICLLFFVLIVVLMFRFMWRYRRRREDQPAVAQVTHNTPLELTWSIVPGLLLGSMFWWGFRSFMDSRTPPRNTYDINVRAMKWSWQFFYPNGHTDSELHVPADTPVRLIMQSDDVIHSCYIPAFRLKRDVVPGRYSYLWFQARHRPADPNRPEEPVRYALLCAEYCGTSHSDMNTWVLVHPTRAAFDAWLAGADPLRKLTDEMYEEYRRDPQAFIDRWRSSPEWRDTVERLRTPAEMGRELYFKKGCAQCHVIERDAPPRSGPSWWDLWGREVALRGGQTVVADENYVRESIVNPNARIVAGYEAIMPRTAITDREIDQLIAFIKTLKE